MSGPHEFEGAGSTFELPSTATASVTLETTTTHDSCQLGATDGRALAGGARRQTVIDVAVRRHVPLSVSPIPPLRLAKGN